MIKNVSDPKLRKMYGNIINDKFPHEVFCADPKINPKTKKPFHATPCKIGFLDQDGRAIDASATNKAGEALAGIETSRDRLDARKGFKCYCGNSSILSKEEKGHFESAPTPALAKAPSKEDLMAIYDAMQKNNTTTGYQFIGGECAYDGFIIREVKE